MVKIAISNCYSSFVEQYNNQSPDTIKEIPVTDAIVETITKGMMERYHLFDREDDIKNAYLIENTGLRVTTGKNMILTFQPTFLILDDIFYNNHLFKRKQNREAFFTIMTESRYTTLKLHCLQVLEKDIELCYFDTILFHLCLDCALQVLLGDKGEDLQETLIQNKIGVNAQKIFIKQGTLLFSQLRETLALSNARIINLENKYDWIEKIK
jgi:hypothetical protein